MLPILLVSNDSEKIATYLDDMIKTGNFSPFSIFRIEPLKTEISIDQIRAIKKEIITATPYRRLFIIMAFDTASLEAQNAFLKTLEEKNEMNQFLLVVTDIGRVLPTVQSRSKIEFSEERSKLNNLNKATQEMLKNIEQSKDFIFLQQTNSFKREDAITLFDQIILILKYELPKADRSIPVILKKALQQKDLLLSNNLNPQLAVDSFLLFYRKQFQSASK